MHTSVVESTIRIIPSVLRFTWYWLLADVER